MSPFFVNNWQWKRHIHIYHLSNRKAGAFIFPTDFTGTGTDPTIKKTLSRLVQEEDWNVLLTECIIHLKWILF